MLVQTSSGPHGLAIYGHNSTGFWVLWLGSDANRGPHCYLLPVPGFNRGAFVAWPSMVFALHKAPDFYVGETAILGSGDSPWAGWYSSGGESPHATFCISSKGEVEYVTG